MTMAGINLEDEPGTTPTGGNWTWDAVHEAFPQLDRWPNWLIEILNLLDQVSSGQRAAPAANTLRYYTALIQAAQSGASDDDLDGIKNTFLSGVPPAAPTGGGAPTGGRVSTGAGPLEMNEFQTIWSNMSPEDRQRYIQMQLGGATSYQQQQFQASQDAANRAYAQQQAQFEYQKQQDALAAEERRKARVAELNKNPRDWATLWSMYGGENLPAGYNPAPLETGVVNPSWAAALQAGPREMAPAGGYAVPTTTPLPGLLRGAIQGEAAPKQAFAMPTGAGVLPSAQYLSKMPGTALEGLAGVYGTEFGLSWDDILQAVQRSLPRKTAASASSLFALGR